MCWMRSVNMLWQMKDYRRFLKRRSLTNCGMNKNKVKSFYLGFLYWCVQVIHIPFGWEEDLTSEYTQQIKYICLIFSKGYIRNNFCDILKFENVIEKRLTGDLRIEELYKTNDYNLEQCS